MAILPFRKKLSAQREGAGIRLGRFRNASKKRGTSSNIAELRSPYVKKPIFTGKFFKRGKRKKTLEVPTIQPKTAKKAKSFLGIIVGLALVGGLIYLIGFSHIFDIKSWEITDDGNKITNDEELNNLLKKQKNQNLIFVDESKLASQVKNIHPELKKVTIKKIFPQKIKIEIEKYPIVANIANVVQGVQKKFLIDSRGFLAEENIENPELPFIKIFTNEVYNVKTTALTEEKLDYIINAINLF